MKISKFKKRKEAGVVVVITVLFIAVLSSIVIALATIIIPRLKVSAEIKRSVGALYAADSAAEYCLYLTKVSGSPVPTPMMQNGATYDISPSPSPTCTSSGVKTTGTYQGVARSLELSGF